jgi:hypothetical protein
MKYFKRLSIIFFSLIIILSLATGCSNNESSTNDSSVVTSQESPSESPEFTGEKGQFY